MTTNYNSRRGLPLVLVCLIVLLWSAAGMAAAPQNLSIVNNTGEDLLNIHLQRGKVTQFMRLDMQPGGSEEIENPGGTADLRLDTGLTLWTFSRVPLAQAESLTFGPKPDTLTLVTDKGDLRQFSAHMRSLLPDENSGPVCALDRFRPGMSMKDVCALLDQSPPLDDNDAVLTSLGFAGMVWAARLLPGHAENGKSDISRASGPDRLEHMELRRKLDATTLNKLLATLYAQGYAPWQAELPGLDMNFVEMPNSDTARHKEILQQVLDYFLSSGQGEATVMLAPAAMLPNLADADRPQSDVQLFTLTLRHSSKNLVVDVAAYQASEGGR
ncbi:MAG: peptidoglycan glycosyltransferase [Desulfovibrio sp.]|nr:peptidoglycan glycosyltransferase [Desulfovibrio sp.]